MSATVCPFIAIATDSGKRLSGANAAHACFAQRPSQPIELDHQERLCLTATFSSCPSSLHGRRVKRRRRSALQRRPRWGRRVVYIPRGER